MYSIKWLSAFMSYQGKMIKTETTEVVHLRQVFTRHRQPFLKQSTISICIEECIGGGITPCRRKLAKMTVEVCIFPPRQHHCIIASRLTGECVCQREQTAEPMHLCTEWCTAATVMQSTVQSTTQSDALSWKALHYITEMHCKIFPTL